MRSFKILLLTVALSTTVAQAIPVKMPNTNPAIRTQGELWDMLSSATKKIDCIVPTLFSRGTATAITNAAKKGVSVTILILKTTKQRENPYIAAVRAQRGVRVVWAKGVQ